MHIAHPVRQWAEDGNHQYTSNFKKLQRVTTWYTRVSYDVFQQFGRIPVKLEPLYEQLCWKRNFTFPQSKEAAGSPTLCWTTARARGRAGTVRGAGTTAPRRGPSSVSGPSSDRPLRPPRPPPLQPGRTGESHRVRFLF